MNDKTKNTPEPVRSEVGEMVLEPYDNEKEEFSLGAIHIDKDGHARICSCARTESGELTADDYLRISQRILGVLEEECCTVAQVEQILRFTEGAASTYTLVKCVSTPKWE